MGDWHPRRTETLVVIRGTQIDTVLRDGESLGGTYHIPVQRNTCQISLYAGSAAASLEVKARQVYAIGGSAREVAAAVVLRSGAYTAKTLESYTVTIAPGANKLELTITGALAGDLAVLWYDIGDTALNPPYAHHEVKAGNAGAAYSADLAFSAAVNRLDIFVWDYPLLLKRGLGGTYGDPIEIPPNSVYSVDAITEIVSVKNALAGVARYQIVGWY